MSKDTGLLTTALMCFTVGIIFVAQWNSLYWWIQTIGIISLIMGVLAVLVTIAEKKLKQPSR